MKTRTTTKNLAILGMLLLPILSFGQWTDCANNNDDPPPYTVADANNSNYNATLDISIATVGPGDDFCIGNDPGKDTEGGCGTFKFTNLDGSEEECGTKFCFSPRQGCGEALGNVCLYEEDPDNPGQWKQLGTLDAKGGFTELCVFASPTLEEYSITICRPGQGPVSINDVTIIPPPSLDPIPDQEVCEEDLSEKIDLTKFEQTGSTGGDWSEGINKISNPTDYQLTGTVGQVITLTYTYDATASFGADCLVSTTVKYTITNTCDQCPDDPNKTQPGACGCGVADVDSDGDGVLDCNENCPNDKFKTEPSICGCGVADTDTDLDGTPDCNDACPTDANKTSGGTCGCGVADTDSDGDGTADCNDACPSDPNKIAAGICGCGVADTDSDGDGTADCKDACPSDPNKVAVGICGCGVADTDSDGDGTADCKDACPSDPNKVAAGICGCGVADTDSDGDGTADCNDACSSDPNKVAAGICGCGVADTDSDGDGTADCNDACPSDPNKVAVGICGCGVADTDSDGDGVLDCNDICANGDDNIDSDGDGTPDACDCTPRRIESSYCTFTQGFYGNSGGKFGGLTTSQIIDNALLQGSIIVGRKGSRSIEIPSRACIFQLLPGGGSAGILHSGDIIVGKDCNPAPNPTKRNGTLQNVLVAQTITLTLNTRYDEHLSDLPLANVCFTIDPAVLAALPTDPTVQDLLEYANTILGGVTSGNYSAVNAAISGINEGFDECGQPCGATSNSSGSTGVIELFCPADFTSCPGSSIEFAITGEALATGGSDNCSLRIDYDDQLMSESCTGAKVMERTWKAFYDGYESEAVSCTQTIKLEDREAPKLSGVPANTLISCSQSIPRVGQPTVTDNCASNLPITYIEERMDGDCGSSYTIRRTWKVEDNCGNAVTGQQTITVVDDVKPTWGNFKWNDTYKCGTTPAMVEPTATDNCGGAVTITMLDETTEAGDCTGATIVRRWRATDACGNRRTRKQYIKQADSATPILTKVANNLTMNCSTGTSSNSLQSWLASNGGASATDDCGNLTWTNDMPTVAFNCGTSHTVTFTATDDCGNAVTTSAVVSMNDNTAPTLIGVPNDQKISCGATVPAVATVTASDNCDPSVSVSFEEVRKNNTACSNAYTLERIWKATDACGNTTEDSQIIEVGDNAAPTLVGVPTNVSVSCNSIPGPATVTATDDCDANVTVQYSQTSSGTFCAGAQLTRTWTATDACGNTSSKTQIITLEDNTPPSLTCPADVQLQASGGCNGSARLNITLPTATDNCDPSVSVTSSHDLASDFAAGTTTITLTATDECNNKSTCSFKVVVAGGNGGAVSQPCPSNMVAACDLESGQSIVSWEPPSGDACYNTCSSETAIAGYLYMGERGGHRYYCSDGKATWDQAMAAASSMGGYLAVINDPAENAFLANFLETQRAYIGLSDAGSEGNFRWMNGETSSYRNWHKLQPNNKNRSQHYTQLLPDGTWNDTYKTDVLEYIIEVPCRTVTQTGGPLNGSSFPVGVSTVTYDVSNNNGGLQQCSFTVTVNPAIKLSVEEDVVFDCNEGTNGYNLSWTTPYAESCCDACPEQQLDGYLYMGRYKGHQYYCSLAKVSGPQAKALAESLGGYLAVINDATENAMLTAFLGGEGSALIGLNDLAQEGKFRWPNGDPITYTNWAANQPDNYNNGQDYVQLLGSNGKWDDMFNERQMEFVVEIPCLEVNQIAGKSRGSFFGPGTHTITYEAVDDCGNRAEESFDITVNACAQQRPSVCSAKANYDNYFWIKDVKVGSISSVTGRDGGYGDFTHLSTSAARGSTQTLTLSPGYASTTYYVYWRVFIDYNQDGDFNDAGEVVFSYRHYNPLKVNFRIPSTCKTGPTVMRVAMSYYGYKGGCESHIYGEVQDYTINITGSSGARTASESRNDGVQVEVIETGITPPTGVPLETEIMALSEPSLKAYPNPVSDLLTIDLENILTTNTALRIFNSVGQQIHLQALDQELQQRVQLDVSQYEDGIYLISIDGDELKPLLQKFTKF